VNFDYSLLRSRICPADSKRQGDRKRSQEAVRETLHRPNENKMSDGGRVRASFGVQVWRSSQKSSVRRSVVRSIAWLDPFAFQVLASLGKTGLICEAVMRK